MPLSWEEFEGAAKEAFVATPESTRFFFKTKWIHGGKRAVYTARVRHRAPASTTPQPPKPSAGEVVHKYHLSETSHLPRITRLLRFGVQEMLGPLAFAQAPMSPTSPPKPQASDSTPGSTVSPPASGKKKQTKKKKKSKGKH